MVSEKHKNIAANIANSSTPGYKVTHLEFQDQLKKAVGNGNLQLSKTNTGHIDGKGKAENIKPDIVTDTQSKGRVDGNTVDLDTEMGELTKNQIMWNSLLTIGKKYGSIKKAAIEGK